MRIAAEKEEDGKMTDRRSVEVDRKEPKTTFHSMTPGAWRVRVIVRLGDLFQPVDVPKTVTLKPGDAETIEPVIRPVVVSGHVTSHGRGVATALAFADPPGPGAITRRVWSQDDGSFRVVLPRPSAYTVTSRRTLTASDTELGPIAFDESSRDVQIALPEGEISVSVHTGDVPASNVEVNATMQIDVPGQPGIVRLQRKARTNADGRVALDELQDGRWLVTARATDGSLAERIVSVSPNAPASVRLDLDSGVTFDGVVVNSAGAPVAIAAVDCIYSGSGNVLRFASTQTDARGGFSLRIAKPAPRRLRCGVTSVDGTIGAYATSPTSTVRFGLPAATSSLTLSEWSSFANVDRVWLVSSDGSVFNATWAARKLRQMGSSLVIPRLPSGAWSVVRADTLETLQALGNGEGALLPAFARARLKPGESRQISITDGDVSAPQ